METDSQSNYQGTPLDWIRYKELFDNISSGVAIYEPYFSGEDFIFKDLNKAAEKIDQVKKSDVVGKRVTAVFPGVKTFGLLEVFQRVFQTGTPEKHPTALYKDNRLEGWRNNYVYKIPTGEIVSVYDDITELKEAEKRTEETKKFFEEIIEKIKDGIWVTDENDKIVFYNTAMEIISGLSEKEALGRSIIYDFPKETNEHFLPSYLKAKETLQPVEYETAIITPAGKSTTQRGWLIPKKKDGIFEGMICTIQDITEQKKAQEEIKKSEENYRSIFDNSSHCIFIHDLETGEIVDVNPATCETFGYTKEELKKMNVGDFSENMHPYTQEEAMNWIHKAAKEGTQNFEWLAKNKKGEPLWFDNTLRVIKINGKERALVIGKDITHQKQTEKLMKATFEHSDIPTGILDPEGKFIKVNKKACDLTNCKEEEIIGKSYKDIIYQEDKQLAIERFEKFIKEEKKPYVTEKRYLGKEGKIIWGRTTISPIFDETGKIKQIIAQLIDITKRKKAEKALKESEEKFRSLFNNSIDWIWEVDKEGKYTHVSDNVKKIMGYEKEEILGKTPFNFMTDEESRRITPMFNDFVLNKSKIEELKDKMLTKNGKELTFETNAIPLIDENGELTGYFGTCRDITEKKKTDEKILKSLEEKEALLKETNHRIKNNLQIITSLLNMQCHSVKEENIKDILRNAQHRIKSIAMIHEKLYPTENVKEISCAEYASALVRYIFESFDVSTDRINFLIDIDKSIHLCVEEAIPCSLIINEIITNSLKHAFPEETKGEIYLTMNKDQNNLTMLIGDNGKGIPPEINFRNTDSMGLKLINTLVDQLGGTIELDRTNGTKYRINFKYQNNLT